METEYHILFSIAMKHSKFGDDPVPGMSVQPTAACQIQLRHYGMVFKNNSTGGFVGIEKRRDQDGNIVPFRPWKQVVDFTFLIKTENTVLLSKTKPYNDAVFFSDLSSSYFIYCDNLNDGNLIDQTESLTNDEVLSDKDIFFLTPPGLSLAGVEEIRVTPFIPQGSLTRQLPEPRNSSPLNLTLETGAYTLVRLFPAGAKTDSIMTGLVDSTTGTVGVIRIFKDLDTDYDSRQHYTLSMQGIP